MQTCLHIEFKSTSPKYITNYILFNIIYNICIHCTLLKGPYELHLRIFPSTLLSCLPPELQWSWTGSEWKALPVRGFGLACGHTLWLPWNKAEWGAVSVMQAQVGAALQCVPLTAPLGADMFLPSFCLLSDPSSLSSLSWRVPQRPCWDLLSVSSPLITSQKPLEFIEIVQLSLILGCLQHFVSIFFLNQQSPSHTYLLCIPPAGSHPSCFFPDYLFQFLLLSLSLYFFYTCLRH